MITPALCRASRTRRPPQAAVVAVAMKSQLRDRVWSVPPSDHWPSCHAFLLAAGAASFAPDDLPTFELRAPALLWLPRTARGQFRLDAGSEGATCTVAEDYVGRSLTNCFAAADLRPLVRATILATSDRLLPHWDELKVVFGALVRECHESQPGGAAVMGLHINLLIQYLWRSSSSSSSTSQSHAAVTMQRFQQLIELHFRDNLTIAQFAGLIGITQGRLHKSCMSTTGRTPLKIVHERLIEEAQLRLEQTSQTAEQIGFSLGFGDAGYFSRFFKRRTGFSPGQYRRECARKAVVYENSYSAWP